MDGDWNFQCKKWERDFYRTCGKVDFLNVMTFYLVALHLFTDRLFFFFFFSSFFSFHSFRLLCRSVSDQIQKHKQTQHTHSHSLTGTVVVNYIFKIANIEGTKKTDGKTHKFHEKLDFVVSAQYLFISIKTYLKRSSKRKLPIHFTCEK